MKVSAIVSTAFFGVIPLLVLAATPDDKHGFLIESLQQANAAASAPFAFQPFVSETEAVAFFAEIGAQTVQAAASGIQPDLLAAQPAQARQQTGDRSSRRKSPAKQTLASLAQGASSAAQQSFGTDIPPTVVPCQTEGSFTLQGTAGPEFVLQVQYQGCQTAEPEVDRLTEINGLVVVGIQVQLGEVKVTRVRFGVPAQAYIETSRSLATNFLTHQLTLSYEVSGVLADPNAVVSSFLHRIDGSFVEETFSDGSFVEPGTPFVAHGFGSLVFDVLVYSGTLFNGSVPSGEVITGREGTLQTGGLTARGFLQDQFGNFFGDDTWVIRVNGLNIVDKSNSTGLRTLTWDGNLNVTFPASVIPGCFDGEYEFRTITPLLAQATNPNLFSQGELRINNNARVTIEADGTANLRFQGERLSFTTLPDLLGFGGCPFFPT